LYCSKAALSLERRPMEHRAGFEDRMAKSGCCGKPRRKSQPRGAVKMLTNNPNHPTQAMRLGSGHEGQAAKKVEEVVEEEREG
jgi:hypothetical protein